MNIYTISPSLSFLDILVEGVFERFSVLDENGNANYDFSDITILLPNRRSSRYLKNAFIRNSDNRTIILPKMHGLGDLDEDELFFLSQEIEEPFPEIRPAIPITEKRLNLARLIKEWYAIEKNGISFDQALKLAIDLSSFLDEVQKEGVSFDNIVNIVPEDLAEHWQITIDFLEILSTKWPEILDLRGYCDNIERRNLLVDLQIEYWKKSPPESPIIVAGSTGSVKSTAKLIKALVGHKNGYLVLPYIDKFIDEEIWKNISDQDNAIHPQHVIASLIEFIGADRKYVDNWCKSSVVNSEREEFISNIMLPGSYISNWKDGGSKIKSVNNISLIESHSQNEEAKIISFILRSVLEDDKKTAALITQDNDLTKRVKSMMLRWNIDIKISSGESLINSSLAVFMINIADVLTSKFSSVDLLALLKHPYCLVGKSKKEHIKYTLMLEKYILRGAFLSAGLESIEDNISVLIPSDEVESFSIWFTSLKECFNEISVLFQNNNEEISLDDLISNHVKSSELLSGKTSDRINHEEENISKDIDDEDGINDEINYEINIWDSEEAEIISKTIEEVYLSSSVDKKYYIKVRDYSEIFRTLISVKYYPKNDILFPRISILSPMEARILHFDLVILGSLNENSWGQAINSSWMNMDMKSKFGLPSANRSIGQSAHDFSSLLCSKEVVITRPAKINGVQTVESPWISRMLALLDITGEKELLSPSLPWHDWVEKDTHSEKKQEIIKPAPKPDINYRPKKFSPTSIATLMKDPYSVYAKYILNLYPVNDIDSEPEALEFGNLIHKILERYVLETGGKGSLDDLEKIGKEEFYIYEKSGNGIKLWWSRFESIAEYFSEKNNEVIVEEIKIFVEALGELKLNINDSSCLLTAKADRIEYNSKTKSVNVIDYKTGAIPSLANMKNGISPQLAIEAMILCNSGYKTLPDIENIAKIENWHLSVDKKNDTTNKIDDVMDLIIQTEKNIIRLLEIFMDKETPYLASPNIKNIKNDKFNDYQHLSRIKEWI